MQSDEALPISIKGIVGPPGAVVLLRNERAEWELPGGRLELTDPNPEACLRREIHEELEIEVSAGSPVHAWRYEPVPGRMVFLVAYRCESVGPWPTALTHSSEHVDVCVMPIEQALQHPELPLGYRNALRRFAVGASG